MPRPRFEKLPIEKQQRILEAAALEFAAHGFEGASLNQILEHAQVSKGAAYYYFDDKLDLFVTVVQHYWKQTRDSFDFVPDELTRETFWPSVRGFYRRQFAEFGERPWTLGVAKAVRTVPPQFYEEGRLASVTQEVWGWMAEVLARGREVGAVRDDLPDELLLTLFAAIDDALDEWVLRKGHPLAPDQIEANTDVIMDILYRTFAPMRTIDDR